MVHDQRESAVFSEGMGWDRANNVGGGGRWQRQEREGVVAVEASIHDHDVIIAPVGKEKKTW